MPAPGGQDSPLLGVSALTADFQGSPSLLAAGTNGNGVLVSQDSGGTWSWSREGLPEGTPITGLWAAYEVMVALIEGGVPYQSLDSGASWHPLPGLGGGVESVAFSPNYASDNLLFAVQHGALLRSTDGGGSWVSVLSASSCPMNVALSPAFQADGTAYAPYCDHVMVSTDAGATWSPVPREGEDLQLGSLVNLTIAPSFPQSGRLLAQGTTQGLPMVSHDGGRSWHRAYDPDQVPFALGTLSANFQQAPDGAYTLSGRAHLYDYGAWLWRSADGGETWHALAHAASISQLVVLPTGTIWLGTSDGIFAGPDWRFVHGGGSNPPLVESLFLSPEDAGAALVRAGMTKYTTQFRVFEKLGGTWQLVFEERANRSPRRVTFAPTYPAERFGIVVGQDYGGVVTLMALRPDSDEPLVDLEGIPSTSGEWLDRFEVTFAQDYDTSGRIEVRHGYGGALYVSLDRGLSWQRPDPAEPGACERNPVSGFGALWFSNDQVRSVLGCPLEDEQPYLGIVQPFEFGELLRLEPVTVPAYDRWTYGLLPEWSGGPAWGTLPVYDLDATLPEPPVGYLPTDPILTSAWLEGTCCRPNPVPAREALGWAVGPAQEVEMARQRFEGGEMLWRGDLDEIAVLLQNVGEDRYTVYPD